MERVFEPARALSGAVRVPGDKSITHRAYLLGAIARGTTRVTRPNDGADCRATRGALKSLGVVFAVEGDEARVDGRPDGFETPAGLLDLGNSGTGLRLLAGLLAGRNVAATLVGDASLSRRPMERIVAPLVAMGATIAARGAGGTPPLDVRGAACDGRRLAGVRWRTRVASAQVKSAVLLAGLSADGVTAIEEPLPSRDHTERMLEAFGVTCARPSAGTVELAGPAALSAAAVEVPGDFSSAFFWCVAATIVEQAEVVVHDVGVNPTRIGALAVLRRMGADIELLHTRVAAGEPVADVRIRSAALEAADVAPEEIPSLVDELPALAIAQAFARGRSRVSGAAELRVKESDRIAQMVRQLRALGGTVDERPDGWEIEGGTLSGGVVDSAGDHRVALAFGVAALAARGPIRVAGADMIDTSYPGFYNDLRERVTSR